MRRRVAGLAVAAALVAALWATWGLDPAGGPAPPTGDPAPTPRPDAGAVAGSPVQPPAPGSPAWRAHQEALVFRDEVRDFFEQAESQGAAEREARAEAIRAGVEARERDGRLLPPEALVLKLGLVRATEDDPAVLEHEIEALLDEHAEDAERAAAQRSTDPRDVEYQERQAAIAREVMALEEVPDGLSRPGYLRERLRALRLEVYGGGE